MPWLIRDNLHMSTYCWLVWHCWTPNPKISHKCAQQLLRWHMMKSHKNNLFTDTKIFTVEGKYNKQNDKICGTVSQEAKEKVPIVQRGHHPTSVRVWWGVSHQKIMELNFFLARYQDWC